MSALFLCVEAILSILPLLVLKLLMFVLNYIAEMIDSLDCSLLMTAPSSAPSTRTKDLSSLWQLNSHPSVCVTFWTLKTIESSFYCNTSNKSTSTLLIVSTLPCSLLLSNYFVMAC